MSGLMVSAVGHLEKYILQIHVFGCKTPKATEAMSELECSKTLLTDGIQFTPCTQGTILKYSTLYMGKLLVMYCQMNFRRKLHFMITNT